MGVGLKVGSIIDEVGTSEFLHSFFSTISYLLEPDGWGTKYPALLGQLYYGALSASQCEVALAETQDIRESLKNYPPSQVVWDIEDTNAKPPWGDYISPDITSLENYFVTSSGRDLFDILAESLRELCQAGGTLTIEQI